MVDEVTDTPWTPGPWALEHLSVRSFISAPTANDPLFATVEGPNREPNARLIAAAPEMAELLTEYVELYGVQPGTLYDKSKWLLSRIRGEA
jgi:hypothetical protein